MDYKHVEKPMDTAKFNFTPKSMSQTGGERLRVDATLVQGGLNSLALFLKEMGLRGELRFESSSITWSVQI